LRHRRLAHAYLFAGPRGSGKEAVARTLAKALNCETKEFDSCDDCDSCRRIDAGQHPDIYWVRPESKSRRISVDQIREFERAINLKPAMAGVKVGVIVDADCLGEEASNAFLKTLEEPPAQTVIILLTAEPQRLLATILSRCLKISFGPAAGRAESPFRARLQPLLEEFAGSGGGRVVKAYRLLAGVTALLLELREKIRQQVEQETAAQFFEGMDPKAREKVEDEAAARIEGEYRGAREQVLEELYLWFADVLLCVEGAAEQLLAQPGNAAATRRFASGLNAGQALTNLEAIEQIRESLMRNITETLAWEVGLLKLETGGQA
jgi:DNA polymerase-3 subunit delta'